MRSSDRRDRFQLETRPIAAVFAAPRIAIRLDQSACSSARKPVQGVMIPYCLLSCTSSSTTSAGRPFGWI
jgi:hypothetical protein